jgi:thymidylate kinase
MTCKVIAFEGADMRGKTTQALRLTEVLQQAGYKTIYLKFPLSSHKVLHKIIYKCIEKNLLFKVPTAFQALNFVDKLLFQSFELKAYEKEYDIIVIDRWKLSSYVYGACSGAVKLVLKMFDDLIVDPTITLVMYGEPFMASSHRRADVIDKNIELQHRLETKYHTLANMYKSAFIKNDGTVNEVNADIMRTLAFRNII